MKCWKRSLNLLLLLSLVHSIYHQLDLNKRLILKILLKIPLNKPDLFCFLLCKYDDEVSNTEVEKQSEESKPLEEDPSIDVKTEPKLPKRCRVGGYPCKQCDRVLMSMQGLRSHERSHLALAMFTREDKYSCQFCSFVSAFRHK